MLNVSLVLAYQKVESLLLRIDTGVALFVLRSLEVMVIFLCLITDGAVVAVCVVGVCYLATTGTTISMGSGASIIVPGIIFLFVVVAIVEAIPWNATNALY